MLSTSGWNLQKQLSSTCFFSHLRHALPSFHHSTNHAPRQLSSSNSGNVPIRAGNLSFSTVGGMMNLLFYLSYSFLYLCFLNQTPSVTLVNVLHCKKELAVFPSPAGMSLIKLFLGGNNLVFSRPERVWSVISRLGTGKWLTLFYSVAISLSHF